MKRSEEGRFREYVVGRMEVMRRTAYLFCRDWHLADDLVGVTVGKLYRHWHRVQDAEHLDAYVRRILVRSWLDEKKRAWRQREVVGELPELAGVEDVGVVERAGLFELLDSLPPRRRAAVVLRFYCDLSVEETAESLGVSVGTVKSQTARGLDTLRARIAEAPY